MSNRDHGIEYRGQEPRNEKFKKALLWAGGVTAALAVMGGWREAAVALGVAVGANEVTEK